MNYSRLVKLNKRQFNRQCNVEGQDIYNHSKSTSEKVIFYRTGNSKSIEEKVTIYFSSDSNIEKGDVLLYKNNYYIVQSINCPENDAWHVSLLTKCNTVWNLFGEIIPLVSGELSSANPRNGTITTVNGTIGLYTKDVDILHTKIGINDVFHDFGGCYKLVNKFFIDGIAFLYFQRQVYVPLDFKIKCANKQYNISNPTQTKFYLMATNASDGNNYYLPTAKFTYSSSDERVAKVNDNGVILPLMDGTFNVVVNCTYTFDYGDVIKNNNTKIYKYNMPFGINTNPDFSGESGSTETPETPEEPGNGNTDNPGSGGSTDPGGSDDSGSDDNTGNEDDGGSGGTTLPSGNLTLELEPSVKSVAYLGYNRAINCYLYVNGVKYSNVPEMPTLRYGVYDYYGNYIAAASDYITLGSKTTNDRFHITLEYNDTTEEWAMNNYVLRVIAKLSNGTMTYVDLSIQFI